MKIVRWIIFVPIGIISFLICWNIIAYILAFIWKILYFLMFWGTRYNIAPVFDFEYAIQDFKVFLFTVCLGAVISGGISGAIAGLVAPKSAHTSVATALYSISMAVMLFLFGYVLWNSEHWFYSICTEVSLIITGLLGIGFMYGVNSHD